MVFQTNNHTTIVNNKPSMMNNQRSPTSGIIPSAGLCKCLFGRPDPEANDIANLTKEVMGMEQKRFKRRWNFDVEQGPVTDSSPPKKEVASVGLAQVVTQYKWEKLENENLPYFYYKPYPDMKSVDQRMRPLTCRNTDEKVPSTPSKRRYTESNEYAQRSKARSAHAKKSILDMLLEGGNRSPVVRRLDFANEDNDDADVQVKPIKSADLTASIAAKIQARTLPPTLPSSASNNMPSLFMENTRTTTAKSPAKINKSKKGSARKELKKSESSPKTQKLITEMLCVRQSRPSPIKSNSMDKMQSPAAGSSKEGDKSSSTTPFGSPVARRNRLSSSQ